MDVGIVFGLSGILIAIFIATIMFVWQANSVSNRFDAGFQAQGAEIKTLGERVDAKIEAQGAEIKALGERLEAEIEAQGAEIKALGERLEAEIKEQGVRLETEIKDQGVRLETEIKAQGQRVSELELEQARLNGVNSVVIRQAHTHETLAD